MRTKITPVFYFIGLLLAPLLAPLYAARAQVNDQTYLIQLLQTGDMTGATMIFTKSVPHQHINEDSDRYYRYIFIEKFTSRFGGATVRMNNFASVNPPNVIPAGTRFKLKAQPHGVAYESVARVFGATDGLTLHFEDAHLPNGKIITGFYINILGGSRHRAASMTVGQLQSVLGNIFTIR
jgi:hypothetical protein